MYLGRPNDSYLFHQFGPQLAHLNTNDWINARIEVTLPFEDFDSNRVLVQFIVRTLHHKPQEPTQPPGTGEDIAGKDAHQLGTHHLARGAVRPTGGRLHALYGI
jgi:hypothetical protein